MSIHKTTCAELVSSSMSLSIEYENARMAIRRAGKLLRTSEIGTTFWAGRHKTALSGLSAVMEILKKDIPRYALETIGK